VEFGLCADCDCQTAAIFGLGDFDGTQTGKMRGQELGIKQLKPSGLQSMDQKGQGGFGGVGGPRKHALAEKRRANHNAINPANQLVAVPDFNRMRMTQGVQVAVGRRDFGIDPRFGAVRTA